MCAAWKTPRTSSSCLDHHGEEDVLCGHNDSGTIFLAHCNTTCVFCQNTETSHEAKGEPATAGEFAGIGIRTPDPPCHSGDFVSQPHHWPHLVEAVGVARDRGINIPIVWNCGGYEHTEVLELLDGIVDVYMPDVKLSDYGAAARYSKAPRYLSNVTESLREIHRRVGYLRIDDAGLATGGLLVRNFVMAEHVKDAEGVFSFVTEELSRDTFINVMAQYRPHYEVESEERYEAINRRITPDEYRSVIEHARSIGLERLEYDPAMIEGIERATAVATERRHHPCNRSVRDGPGTQA